MTTDTEYMQRALRLAEKGRYTTDPNPRVGCVIVNGGRVVGEGWHRRAGEAHAEVNALAQAGAQSQGATAYVTLEPCSHTGKTPPCADALVEAGVKRVVAAMQDPNPLVAGQGLAKLAAQGIEVESGLLEAQARELNPGFIRRMESGRPYVRVKFGMSLDGRTAMASGESKWITSEAARRDVQFMRAGSSAILTGSGTVLADDPSMTVRLGADELGIDEPVRQPVRVVIDSGLRTPPSAKILAGPGECWLLTTEQAAASANVAGYHGACIKTVATGQHDQLDLAAVMQFLAAQEVNLVHVEAGAKLCGALLQAKLVDEIVLYMAPVIMGDDARGLFHLPGLTQMKDRLALDVSDIRTIGKDLRITALPVYENSLP